VVGRRSAGWVVKSESRAMGLRVNSWASIMGV
jgi:hypothetical protein